ncbi:TPA: hypothetical protein I7185_02925 [Vibrio vulnificus]|nr:hypothetical protein [Vibrio vulnificus]
MNFQIKSFFDDSEYIRELVLQPLEHIRSNWDLYWDDAELKYVEEENSFAKELNELILEISSVEPLINYHKHEDKVADNFSQSSWAIIEKKERFWVGEEYRIILEQGGFEDFEQSELILASAGRVKAALGRSQYHIDVMEDSHRKMLCIILSIVLYHRF